MSQRRKRKLWYSIYCEGYWWAPKEKRWITNEGIHDFKGCFCSSRDYINTFKRAKKYARKLPVGAIICQHYVKRGEYRIGEWTKLR